MSADHMGLVYTAEGLSSAEKAVLLAMCFYTDAHGRCYPGMKRLQVMTSLSESTIKRTRRGLEQRGLLQQWRRTSKAGDATSNLYRVDLTLLASLSTPGRQFDDDDLLDELGYGEPSYPQKRKRPDQRIGRGGPTPGTGGGSTTTPPPAVVDPGGVTMTPPPVTTNPPGGHGDPLSVIRSVSDQLASPIRNAADAPPAGASTDERITFLSEITDQAGAELIVAQLPLGSLDAKPSQVVQIRDAVAAALATGITPDTLTSYLLGKVSEARTVKYLLGSLTAPYIAALTTATGTPRAGGTPPVCGFCDARDGDPIGARTITRNGRIHKCEKCHPHHTAESLSTG